MYECIGVSSDAAAWQSLKNERMLEHFTFRLTRIKMFIFIMQLAEFTDAGVFNCSIMGLLDFFPFMIGLLLQARVN